MAGLFEDRLAPNCLGEDRLVPLEAAARAWADVSAQTVKRLCGLAIEPWSVAAALHRHGMLPQSRLSALCHTHKVAISRAVDVLVQQKQWVVRLPSGSDGRIRHLILTEKGLAEAAIVAAALADLRDLCLAEISEGDVAQMHALLLRVKEGVRRIDLRGPPGKPRFQVIPDSVRAEIKFA